jgi:hypothetical protein
MHGYIKTSQLILNGTTYLKNIVYEGELVYPDGGMIVGSDIRRMSESNPSVNRSFCWFESDCMILSLGQYFNVRGVLAGARRH